MKTLYININKEQIQSNDELEVLNYDLDSDFFFYLGEKIAKGCKVENENALITDFNTQDNAENYQKIIAQWHGLKTILFGEKCEGEFKFVLPDGYIHWLRYSGKYNHVYDKNFSHGESPAISIDLEELYEESVEDLQRKILRKLQRDDLHQEIDEIVFNDDVVTRKSPIVCNIKEKYDGVGFKTYKKWLQDIPPQVCDKYKKNDDTDNLQYECNECGRTGECDKADRGFKMSVHAIANDYLRGLFAIGFITEGKITRDNTELYIYDRFGEKKKIVPFITEYFSIYRIDGDIYQVRNDIAQDLFWVSGNNYIDVADENSGLIAVRIGRDYSSIEDMWERNELTDITHISNE